MRTIQTERAGGAYKLELGADGEVSVDEADMPLSELSASYRPDEASDDSVAQNHASRGSR